MSEALYRKYRPRKFSEVIGQDHVVKVLEAEAKSGEISHAYLFAGTRGTGKTSVARIFADTIGVSKNDIQEYRDKKYRFFVAEENGEVVGIAGLRSAPEHMKVFAKTNNPAEFYVLASKYKGRGIGEALRLKRMEEAKNMGFTEIVLYSPNSHSDSWGFHDRLGFERVGDAVAPDGEPGKIWRTVL